MKWFFAIACLLSVNLIGDDSWLPAYRGSGEEGHAHEEWSPDIHAAESANSQPWHKVNPWQGRVDQEPEPLDIDLGK